MNSEECSECGALVNPYNRNRHSDWHSRQKRQIRKILHDGQALDREVQQLRAALRR